MLWTIISILVLLWILGFAFHVAGGLVNILIVAAIILFIWSLIGGRRSV
jgi:hypothetical protein